MTEVRFFDYLSQYRAIKPQIQAAVERVLESGSLILGAEVKAFEQEFASFLGGGHSVGVGNGTDAIAVILRAMGIGPGDEVITVANTAVPTVSAIREVGAVPVFCDVDPDSCLIDLDKVAGCVSDKTRAVVPVHLFGNAVDVEALRAALPRADIRIIEDCAQAHGARIRGASVGTLGDAASFSFYPTKNLGAYGDGGLSFTGDAELAERMRSIRMYGFEQHYYSEREGVNSRLDELQAAILRVKLAGLGASIDRRRQLAAIYDARLPKSVRPVAVGDGVDCAYHLYVVRVQARDELRAALQSAGIGCGVHYPFPIHRMRGYAFLGYGEGSLPVTEQLAETVLSLPIYPELEDADVERVCAALDAALAG